MLSFKTDRPLYEIIIPWDSAVEPKSATKYAKSRNPKDLVIKPGEQPTIFHMMPASKALVRMALTTTQGVAASSMDQNILLSRYGIQKISNLKNEFLDLEVVDSLSGPIPVWFPWSKPVNLSHIGMMPETNIITEEEINAFGAKVIQFIGTEIQRRALLA